LDRDHLRRIHIKKNISEGRLLQDLFQLNGVYTRYGKNQISDNKTDARSINTLDLKDLNIDAVFICSPDSTHFTYTKAALEGGKHVFVEKPLTNSLATCDEETLTLIQKAVARGKILMAGFQRRYEKEFKHARKQIKIIHRR